MIQSVQEIPLAKIQTDDIRTRRDAEAIKNLEASLKEVGQLNPVRLRPEDNGYAIVDGHRRCAALAAAGARTVQAIVEEAPLTEAEALQKALISNTQREALGPVDTARAIARLISATSWNSAETAARLGMAPSTVAKLLAILQLPEDVVEAIANKRIPATAASALARISDPTQQAAMARQLADGQLTRDSLAAAVRSTKKRRYGAAKKRTQVPVASGFEITVTGPETGFEPFITACEAAVVKAKKARAQQLSFETFLKVARDQSQTGG